MDRILNFIAVLTTVGYILEKFMNGNLSVEVTTLILVLLVVVLGISSIIGKFLKIIYSIITFSLLFLKYTNNKEEYISLMEPILTATIALFLIYLIVSKVFGLNSKSDNDVHFTYNKRTGKIKKDSKWF